ncbi:MAG: ABC transporter substrate-binding protein [Actinobacteria bacterium]|nr:ABC transporter substrate-binding protein [Actinomycetota bacterium]MBI3686707.1 ABC transporter substrate-binding protein [Actinomycetota bacterium]
MKFGSHRAGRGRRILVGSVAALGALGLTACSSGLQGASSGSSSAAGSGSGGSIKIGYISPRTGVYAGFTDGDPFLLSEIRRQLAKGIEVGGKTYQVEILDRDSGSDPQKAGQLADDLINKDKVDVILATSTPETVNPVVAKCEAEAVPCITTIAPWQAVYFGGGFGGSKPMKWTNHFFFGLEGFAGVDPNAWNQIQTNKKVGVLWPNDADGQAFRNAKTGYAPIAGKRGYTIVDPGAYENGTKDFTAIINKFKQEHVEILAGVPVPPDFVTFWTQAAQQGFRPKAVTVGKALFFPATVPSIPNNLGQGLSFAAWWGPTFPYKSSLTGDTAQQFIDKFQASPEGQGLTWNQATPLNYALFEVAKKALEGSGNPNDKAAVHGAVSKLTVDTLAGKLDWANGPVPGIATIPTVIAQWELKDGKWDWVVVANESFPDIPAVRKLEPLS